jgi:methylase of polypeptide subunit release factors
MEAMLAVNTLPADLELIKKIIERIEPGATLRVPPISLFGGRTDAKVFYLRVRGPAGKAGRTSIAGHNVLKISRKRLWDAAGEAEKQRMCSEYAPEFMKRFTPALHPLSGNLDERHGFLLFTLGNPEGLDRASTFLTRPDGQLERIAEQIVLRLLGGVPTDPVGLNSILDVRDVTLGEMLLNWLGEGSQPKLESRLKRLEVVRQRLVQESRVGPAEIKFDDRILPDPLDLLKFQQLMGQQMDDVQWGLLHGDLHAGNLLVKHDADIEAAANGDGESFWLLDFEHARRGPLFYDQAYFQMSLLTSASKEITPRIRLNLIQGKSVPSAVIDPNVLRALRQIDKSMERKSLENSNLKPEFDRQWVSAKFAAGLNWASKDYPASEHHKAEQAYLFCGWLGRELLRALALESLHAQRAGLEERDQLLPRIPNRHVLEGGTDGRAVSGLLIINSILQSGISWGDIRTALEVVPFRKLREGIKFSSAEATKVRELIDRHGLFRDSKNLAPFLALQPDKFEERLALVGDRPDSKSNISLQRLIRNKIEFNKGRWLDKVKRNLIQAAKLKVDDSLAMRTWNLRRAYYHAGIQLTAEQMAEAAVADFSHARWQTFINNSPQLGIPHLKLANEKIAQLVAEALAPKGPPDRDVRILEGGSGGGHTTYFVLKALEERHCKVQYRGLELVPALAEGLNAMLIETISLQDVRTDLFAKMRTRNQLKAFDHDGNGQMVVTGNMEDSICDLWDDFSDKSTGETGIDAFVASFAFHHVPNGQAITKYIANDAQGFKETLDREPLKAQIAEALALGCSNLYIASTDAEARGVGEDVSDWYSIQRKQIIEAAPKEFPQVAVFLSLLEPSALSQSQVDHFCKSIREHKTYPADDLRRMLRNPQREVLLTVQSLLRDRGVLVIADPDGTSDFNAENAWRDKELTIANFLTSNELKSDLSDMGFDGIRVLRLEKTADGKCVVRENEHEPFSVTGARDLGYIVFARRDLRRERELASVRPREFADIFPEDLEPDPNARDLKMRAREENIGKLGKLLRLSGGPHRDANIGASTSDIIRKLFTSPDPMPFSGRVFRYRPQLRRILHSLSWLQLLSGASVLATRRIHVFDANLQLGQKEPVFIATDFPETPQEARNKQQGVFSYSDEADELLTHGESLIDRQKKGFKILDLCAGAGTVGIICAVRNKEASICCVDSLDRALKQITVNRLLNGVPESRLRIEKADAENPWAFDSAGGRFDLILADPPFSLRNDPAESRQDDGGKFGDSISSAILSHAADYLEQAGTLLLLAYSLHKSHKLDLAKWKPDNLEGSFEPIFQGKVWRYRHDKIIGQDWNDGKNLRYLALRLGDPTRPDSMIYESAKEQHERFTKYANWLEKDLRQFDGIQFVIGSFTKK